MTALAGTIIVGVLVIIILAIFIALFATIGIVRFARTGSISEAFNFSAILTTIGKIGWGTYILALIIIFIIIGIIQFICMAIPYIGLLLLFILIPFLALLQARYICLLYDSVGTA
jgi:hypothetical protein